MESTFVVACGIIQWFIVNRLMFVTPDDIFLYF